MISKEMIVFGVITFTMVVLANVVNKKFVDPMLAKKAE